MINIEWIYAVDITHTTVKKRLENLGKIAVREENESSNLKFKYANVQFYL